MTRRSGALVWRLRGDHLANTITGGLTSRPHRERLRAMENLFFEALGGADHVTVNDLSGTDTRTNTLSPNTIGFTFNQ